MEAEQHSKIIGISFLVHGAMWALVVALIAVPYYVVMGFMSFNPPTGAEMDAFGLVIAFIFPIFFFGILLIITVVFPLRAGWKMLKLRPRSRASALIASILSLWQFPVGTAIGIYCLWFLFSEEGQRFFESSN